MADTTLVDFTTNQGSQGLAAGNPVVFYEQYIDASDTNLANLSYSLFDVPEGHVHMGTTLEILTIEDSAAAVEIGITGGDTDGFLPSVDLTSTAGTWDLTLNQTGAAFSFSSGVSVPEPSVALLLGVGLIGFGVSRKLRKTA